MQHLPYFCPNCRANRTKFRIISRISQQVQKDAFDGELITMGDVEPFSTIQGDTEVQCEVCNYVAYGSSR